VTDSHDHDHDHDHDDHYASPSSRRPRPDLELRTMALEAALVDKGLIFSDAVDELLDIMENRIGPHEGARAVARAWTDPEFKDRLLADGTSAIGELGISGPEGNVRVVENTPDVHNLVVCTLCSCYPWPLLGLPPVWYKSFAYRARAVAEPRAVLREFGVELDDSVEVRVWDSSAEVRYFVLPERPSGTEDLDADELAALVSRDSMVGAGQVVAPA
jgi:nitrile hydratase